jgi:4-alpha-glucanotransferase
MASHADRRAGLLLPLFSCPSSTSWGIGDIGDLRAIAAWLAGAGQRVVQLLPLNEMATGQQSPYSALSAMAIDPIFICLAQVPEWAAVGGEAALNDEERAALAQAREASHVMYASVRALKRRALGLAFDRFHDVEWNGDTPRAEALRAFVGRESWWIDDYALFRALHDRESARPWDQWPDRLRRRDARALDDARAELSREIRFYQYLQWIANIQWEAARHAAHVHGVALFGDLPFMVDGDSADVWAHQHQFRLDASVGVPPDAFSATGQDWGMPPYRWDALAADDFRWLRHRARRSAALFDGYRVDHLVGFYRTYARPRDGGEPSFSPEAEADQIALGERMLQIFREPGSEVIAEDLGTVPDFVRASLARLEVPGFRVFRWEREWQTPSQPFRDPRDYPALSVATSGTHDTETLASWWMQATDAERQHVADIPSIRTLSADCPLPDAPFLPAVRDVLLEALMASGSNLLLLPVQDVFGWSDRINEPATVTSRNWTFRLPWPSDALPDAPEARERQQTLRIWAERYQR